MEGFVGGWVGDGLDGLVNISRRIFLGRSQGLKCTKKLKKSLDPEAYFPKNSKQLKISLVTEAYIS